MKKKYKIYWVHCVRQASGETNTNEKTRWMWKLLWRKEKKNNNSNNNNDEIAIGFDAETLWQICGLNVTSLIWKAICSMPIILCTRTCICCLFFDCMYECKALRWFSFLCWKKLKWKNKKKKSKKRKNYRNLIVALASKSWHTCTDFLFAISYDEIAYFSVFDRELRWINAFFPHLPLL